MKIGIIAEDESDYEVLREITLKLLLPHTNVGFKKTLARGSGSLRRKCRAYALNLVERGCPYIVVMHDLDDNQEAELRGAVQASLENVGANITVVLIPKHEIESWLMFDALAIAQAFRENVTIPLPAHPEAIINPKEHLGGLIWRYYRKRYVSPVHNPQIARNLDVTTLNRSVSFAPHPPFVEQIKFQLP